MDEEIGLLALIQLYSKIGLVCHALPWKTLYIWLEWNLLEICVSHFFFLIFSGTTCEINVDECSSNPCQNNATCVDDVNGYICECHQGFRGKKVCFVGVATMLVEPRPYKCVGSGKSLLMSTNTCICECHQGFRGKKIRLLYGRGRKISWATPL